MTDLKRQIKSLLGYGKAEAITADSLAEMLNTNSRVIRLAIEEMINDGIPVASSTGKPAGYFLATTWAEVNEYIRVMRSRLIGDAHRIKAFKLAARKSIPPEQIKLGI